MKQFILVSLLLCAASLVYADVDYSDSPSGWADGGTVKLNLYLQEDLGNIRAVVKKSDNGNFQKSGSMRFYCGSTQTSTVSYAAGASSVTGYFPLDFASSYKNYKAKAYSSDGSIFTTGTIRVSATFEEEIYFSDDERTLGTLYENKQVSGNTHAPTITIQGDDCKEVLPGEEPWVEISVSDQDGDSTHLRWDSDLEILDWSSNLRSVKVAADEDDGEYLVRVYASDGKGQTSLAVASVLIESPEAPTPTPTPFHHPDLAFVNTQNTGSGMTEVHILNGDTMYQSFYVNAATALHPSDLVHCNFEMQDWDGDGITDFCLIATGPTGSGKTEVHVMSGADNFQTFILHTTTAFEYANPAIHTFMLRDWNQDGVPDLCLIAAGPTGSGMTEVHILDGSTYFQSFLVQTATALHTCNLSTCFLDLQDWDRDGVFDLCFINTGPTGSGKTEVHALSGSDLFQTFILHTTTWLGYLDHVNGYLRLADWNGDQILDLCLIATGPTGSGMTELHAMDGSIYFQDFNLHCATILHYADTSKQTFYLANW